MAVSEHWGRETRGETILVTGSASFDEGWHSSAQKDANLVSATHLIAAAPFVAVVLDSNIS